MWGAHERPDMADAERGFEVEARSLILFLTTKSKFSCYLEGYCGVLSHMKPVSVSTSQRRQRPQGTPRLGRLFWKLGVDLLG